MKGIPREAQEELSDRQYKLVIGTLLGDGCLLKPDNWGKNYRLQIEHSKKQKEYVFWKFNELRDWVITKPKVVRSHQSWRFKTKSHIVFTKIASDFYVNGKKIIPDYVWRMITKPLVLAVWYMDDGGVRMYRNDVYCIYLNTHSFTRKEVQRVADVFKKDLKIDSVLESNHGKWRLRINHKNIGRFVKTVYPYILPSFKYKLPVAP